MTPKIRISEFSAQRGGDPQLTWPTAEAATSHSTPQWTRAVCDGLGYSGYLIQAIQNDTTVGSLPLALVSSRLFGRFLVSLPYVNSAGVVAQDDEIASLLIDAAVQIADQLRVKKLELRHEREYSHPQLNAQLTSKVHMRLTLPPTEDELWSSLKAKVRNQVRKGEKAELTCHWGGRESLDEFYRVFSRNMRDLGTPVYGRDLFLAILSQFGESAEFCVIRLESQPVAAALLIHDRGITEVPSASSLREYNSTNANMFMYWQLLRRAIERQSCVFDFGRSTADSNTFRFKKQWGAEPHPAVWQYYVRDGEVNDMRPDSGKFAMAIRLWKKLPVSIANCLGPRIVRGIP